MKIRKIVRIMLLTLASVALLAYMAYAAVFMSGPDKSERCREVELIVGRNSQARFFSEKEVEKLLKDARVYPKGMLMSKVNTKKLEDVLRQNEFVEDVECYKSSNGKLCVKVDLRTPVLYILPDGAEGYLVDAHGKLIPGGTYVTNLPVATGNIDKKYASTKLSDFGLFLQTDEFWNNQIEQIYVQRNKKGESVVELVPRVGNQIIYLGSIDDYQHKLRKLKTFYQKAMGVVGWNKYAKVNLEYGSQIICTMRHD